MRAAVCVLCLFTLGTGAAAPGRADDEAPAALRLRPTPSPITLQLETTETVVLSGEELGSRRHVQTFTVAVTPTDANDELEARVTLERVSGEERLRGRTRRLDADPTSPAWADEGHAEDWPQVVRLSALGHGLRIVSTGGAAPPAGGGQSPDDRLTVHVFEVELRPLIFGLQTPYPAEEPAPQTWRSDWRGLEVSLERTIVEQDDRQVVVLVDGETRRSGPQPMRTLVSGRFVVSRADGLPHEGVLRTSCAVGARPETAVTTVITRSVRRVEPAKPEGGRLQVGPEGY